MENVMHLDSCILRAMMDKDDDAENRRTARHLMNTHHGRPFRVSIAAIGEVFGKMAEDSDIATCAEAGAELRKLFLRGDLELFGMGCGNDIWGIAQKILEQDPRLTNSDIMIASSALADPQCDGFLTKDFSLMESRVLAEMGNERGVAIINPELISKHARSSCSLRSKDKSIRTDPIRNSQSIDIVGAIEIDLS